MILYLVRHAIALDRAEWHKSDSERPLTSEGIHKMRRIAKGLKRLHLGIDAILTSPYRRTYDTAVLVAKALNKPKKITKVEELGSKKNPENFVRYLVQNVASDATVLVVGHDPYLSRLVSIWIGSSSRLDMDFKKGGLCKLTVDKLRYGACATLEWWVPPKLLRRLR